jgi:type II restriction/modification system DNA methylase subunit YeeA
MSLTPKQFVKKWSQIQLKEKSASQSHFNDICALVGHKTPSETDPRGEFFTFEADADKPEGERGWADAWYKNKFIWEYKGPHGNLDAAYQQLLLYKDSLGNPPLLITSDIQIIYIHTNFTNTVKKIFPVTFDTLLDGPGVELLRLAFYDPEKLRPTQTQEQVTKATARDFVEVAEKLRTYTSGKNIPPEQLAHFLVRLLFCLFAEDIKLLPNDIFSKLIRADLNAAQFEQSLRMLFAAMRTGGIFGVEPILHFNGGLFDNDFVPETVHGDIVGPLRNASQHDWSRIDPSIFGTLFERIIDESKRAQLGAHYTSKDDILLVVEPVLMQPLREKWQIARMNAETTARSEKADEAFGLLKTFSNELAALRVLDPACGSGNFLYLALRQLLDLQKEIITLAARLGLPEIELSVGPHQIYGIEINPYAHELAQITVWIGYLQWRVENGFAHMEEPILKPLKQIEHRDAILRTSHPVGETDNIVASDEPVWPEVDFIIGNPPFLGSRKMRPVLGNSYCDALFKVYEKRVDGLPDLVCYWFEKAQKQIAEGKAKRAGLLATQAIRGGTNRQVLDAIKDNGDIFMAWSDKEWILDGATVHVSIIGFDDGSESNKSLDGIPVASINSDLTADVDISGGLILPENQNISFQGVVLRGKFDISRREVNDLLKRTDNPNGRPNSDVIRSRRTGEDIVNRNSDSFVVDFGINMPLEEASKYLGPFEYLKQNVYEMRQKANQAVAREKWWIHWNPRNQMRAALVKIPRYIATPRVAKHRIFVWLINEILPDAQLVVFARDDDYFFGVLHSVIHEFWSRRKGTQLRDAESGFRYTSTTTFETFPFPWPPGKEPQSDPRVQAIAAAAKQLDDFRTEWLIPSSSLYSGSIGEKILQKRTLTNLYNALSLYRQQYKGKQRDMDAWRDSPSGPIASLEDAEMLDHLHIALDHAVLDAYGWPHNLSEEQILERLLALNLERAK